MKYIFSILCFTIFQFGYSQATRFIYQATMTPDSTNVSKKTERVYLDIDGQNSTFYSENRAKRDSVMNRMRQTRNFDRSQMQDLRSGIDFTVEKNLVQQNINFKQRLGRDQYTYTENIPNNWTILPETIKIGNYQTQKAQIQYGGRIWYAWFTPEVPLQDGPYKFGGLPGLIIKLEDSKGDYSFDLMESKKIPNLQSPQSRSQDIRITKEKFMVTQKKFMEDPSSFMGNMTGNNRRSAQGTNPRQMQDAQKKRLEELGSRNNPIELK